MMNTKKKTILLIGISLALSLILILLLVFPIIGGNKKDLEKLVEIKKETIIIDNKKGDVSESDGDCVLKPSDFKRSQEVFANLQVPVGLIEFFEDESSKSGLTMNISPISSKKIDDDLWEFVSFRLSVYGPYNNFMKFFRKIESSQFLIEIQDLSINKLSEREAEEHKASLTDIKANINLRVFAK